MAKKLAAILLCVVLIFVGVLALGHLTRPLGDDVAIANVENFHKLPENSIDVIVYGSSHAWRNVNADEMYDKYGIGAYNYAANWQHLDTTWLFVHDSLATQTPKVALIEGMHINSNEFDTDMDGEIYYTTPIPESKYKRAYLKMCFENHIERYISYYFPLVAYHENKNALTAESFGRTSNSIDFMDTMGFYPRDGVFVADVKDWTEMENWVIGDRSLELMDDMVAALQEKGCQVVFWVAPWSTEEYQYFNVLQEYCEEHNCGYLNMFEHMEDAGISAETDFCDPHHLNVSGATKMADYLGAYLKENYDLTQYPLACDRQNNDLGRFYDPHHPAVLRLIKLVTENAHKNGIWVGICGELGADLALTETFLAMGLDELSVTPRAVLPLRNAVRMTDTRESAERLMAELDADYTAR